MPDPFFGLTSMPPGFPTLEPEDLPVLYRSTRLLKEPPDYPNLSASGNKLAGAFDSMILLRGEKSGAGITLCWWDDSEHPYQTAFITPLERTICEELPITSLAVWREKQNSLRLTPTPLSRSVSRIAE